MVHFISKVIKSIIWFRYGENETPDFITFYFICSAFCNVHAMHIACNSQCIVVSLLVYNSLSKIVYVNNSSRKYFDVLNISWGMKTKNQASNYPIIAYSPCTPCTLTFHAIDIHTPDRMEKVSSNSLETTDTLWMGGIAMGREKIIRHLHGKEQIKWMKRVNGKSMIEWRERARAMA